jgi:transposase
MTSDRRHFTTEFKREAVRLAEGSRSPGVVARQLGVRTDLLRKWRRLFATPSRLSEGTGGRAPLTREEEEIRQLRREVAQLKEER